MDAAGDPGSPVLPSTGQLHLGWQHTCPQPDVSQPGTAEDREAEATEKTLEGRMDRVHPHPHPASGTGIRLGAWGWDPSPGTAEQAPKRSVGAWWLQSSHTSPGAPDRREE